MCRITARSARDPKAKAQSTGCSHHLWKSDARVGAEKAGSASRAAPGPEPEIQQSGPENHSRHVT